MADKKVNLKDASAKEAKAKDAALESAVVGIHKEFGEGSLMRLGDKGTVKVEAIPTGALALDLALGIGGVPRGRIVEIFGPESSGKTTLVNRTKTVCIFTNQIREKVGVQFGSPETQPGGRALKFYSSQRLDIRRIETLKEGTEAVGNRVRVKVVKNKVAAPFRQAEFDIEYGEGISREGGLLDFGMEQDLVQKSGSFFSYGEVRLGQGRNNAKQFLVDNPELAAEIEGKVRAALGIDGEQAEDTAVPPPVPEAQAA